VKPTGISRSVAPNIRSHVPAVEGEEMKPDPTKLLEVAGIETPLIGFYDVPDARPFAPFARPSRCFFSCYENWLRGESICISEKDASCRGGGYWVAGVEFTSRDNLAKVLTEREG
jgi:hypothetical protein